MKTLHVAGMLSDKLIPTVLALPVQTEMGITLPPSSLLLHPLHLSSPSFPPPPPPPPPPPSLNNCLFVGCLTSQQHASVSQGRICSDNFTCCHTEIEVADQTFYLTQLQYTDTGLTSPSTHPITPGTWQDSHGSANV